jgi:hypothetical protein
LSKQVFFCLVRCRLDVSPKIKQSLKQLFPPDSIISLFPSSYSAWHPQSKFTTIFTAPIFLYHHSERKNLLGSLPFSAFWTISYLGIFSLNNKPLSTDIVLFLQV